MVLQNKYKKLRSTKYNNSRSRGRGVARIGKSQGRGRGEGINEQKSQLPSDQEQEEEDYESDIEEGKDHQVDKSAPKLPEINTTQGLTLVENNRPRGKFSRRKLVDNSWRYEEPVEDPNLIDELIPDDDYTYLNKREVSTVLQDSSSSDEEDQHGQINMSEVEDLRFQIEQAKSSREIKTKFANNGERRLKQPATIISQRPRKETQDVEAEDFDEFIDSIKDIQLNGRKDEEKIGGFTVTKQTTDDDAFIDDILG